MRFPYFAIVVPVVVLVLTGCATSANPTASSEADSVVFHGAVHGGQQPVAGAIVTVWAAGSSGYGTGASAIATALAPTDAHGNFNFGAITCPSPATPTYITAQGGDAGYSTNAAIMLATGLGPCSGLATLDANINEVTTVATAYALSHFFTTTLGTGSTDAFGGAATQAEVTNAGLVMANASTIPTLVALNGTANSSTAAMMLETAKLNTLANILAACINSAGPTGPLDLLSACGQLFAATTPPGATTRPSDTQQAAVQMALYPYQNVAALAALPPAASPFVGLSTTPTDLTLAVGYRAPGLGLAINGTANAGSSSNLDIDATGRIWFPTNTASAHGLAVFDPTTNTFAGPYATALADPQYLAIDIDGIVWGTDMAGNQVVGALATHPASLTTYTTAAGSTTGPIGITSNAAVANALLYAVTATGGSTIYQAHGGAQATVATTTYQPTGLAPYAFRSDSGYFEAEVATSGAATPCQLEAPYVDKSKPYEVIAAITPSVCVSGGIAQLAQASEESTLAAASLNEICSYLAQTCFAPVVALNQPEGVAVDGDGNVWIANAGNGSVSTLGYARVTNTIADYLTTSPIPYAHAAAMPRPYGIAIDASGNVWLSNAGCVSTTGAACTPTPFVLTELVGAAAPAITPLGLQTTGIMNGMRPAASAPVLHGLGVSRHGGGA